MFEKSVTLLVSCVDSHVKLVNKLPSNIPANEVTPDKSQPVGLLGNNPTMSARLVKPVYAKTPVMLVTLLVSQRAYNLLKLVQP